MREKYRNFPRTVNEGCEMVGMKFYGEVGLQ